MMEIFRLCALGFVEWKRSRVDYLVVEGSNVIWWMKVLWMVRKGWEKWWLEKIMSCRVMMKMNI